MLTLNTNTYLGNVVNANQSEGCCIGRVRYNIDNAFDDMHCHENPHFSLVVNGGNVEKRKHISFERLPGMVTFYHAGEAHQNTYHTAGSSHINIEISSSWLHNNFVSTDQPNQHFHSYKNAAMLMLKMYKESVTNDNFSADSIKMLLIKLLADNDKETLQKPVWLNIVEQLLNDRWNETPTLHDLSAAAGVHSITISKHFSKYLGCTLGEYMRQLKIVRAIALMKTTDTTLTDIAYECGFADQSHFIRTFKQHTGLLPGEYMRL